MERFFSRVTLVVTDAVTPSTSVTFLYYSRYVRGVRGVKVRYTLREKITLKLKLIFNLKQQCFCK
jgi:hypothetical protein